jgi:hypothetical protein
MALFVRRDVQRIFEHRAAVLVERFGAHRGERNVRWGDADPITAAAGAP